MNRRRILCLLALPALLLLSGPVVTADVLTTAEGLVLEGKVERLPDGGYRLNLEQGGVLVFAAKDVTKVQPGVSPRSAWRAETAKVAKDDVAGLYRQALRAEEAGYAELAAEAYRGVVSAEPNHLAARRALGYERVGDEWVDAATARRRKGLVLFHGAWMLPAEVEAASRGSVKPAQAAADEKRARALVQTLATAPEPLRQAARAALAKTPTTLLLPAAHATLYHDDPKVRVASCRLLAELGDESSLRPLILSGARDKNVDVRREAVLAAASFGHDDTAIPFARALGSKNQRLAGYAAQALAVLGDQRAAGYIVKRLESHGSSTRNFVAFMNQISYVRDYDVEIAQASNIANPDVATIQEGVILDVRVLDAAYTKTWIEPLLVKSFNELVGQNLRSAGEVRAWYAQNRQRLPGFPERPNKRAPRRVKGRLVGARGH